MNNPDDRIELRVVGLTYSQNRQGAYALILGQTQGPVRIPVVIGAVEAQAIAMMIEGVSTPRPLTHDLMSSMLRAFDITLDGVFIYKFEDGIFSSEITLSDGLRHVTIDCRTSDAVALAMRMRCRIETTRAVMDETGFVIEDDPTVTGEGDTDAETIMAGEADDNPSLEELRSRLEKAVADELYEEAARLSAIIKRKEEESKAEESKAEEREEEKGEDSGEKGDDDTPTDLPFGDDFPM